MPSFSGFPYFSLSNIQKTGKDFQKIEIDINSLAWNVYIESDRLYSNPLEWGMPSFIWHSTTLIDLEKWSQGFLTTVSGMGFDTNPFVPHKS